MVSAKRGQRLVLDGVSLLAPSGEVHAILGPNGAGKTTLLQVVARLLEPSSGTIELVGRRPWERCRIGVVPQEVSLYPSLTIEENLATFAAYARVPRRDRRGTIETALRTSDLHDRRHERVSTLSGGMRRRLSLAIALLGEPDLLVLDEPTVGVDQDSRRRLLERIGAAVAERGIPAIMTSHQLNDIEHVCSTYTFLVAGQVVASGATKESVLALGTRIRFRSSHPSVSLMPGLMVDGAHRTMLVEDLVEAIVRLERLTNGEVDDVTVRPATLDDLFEALAGSLEGTR